LLEKLDFGWVADNIGHIGRGITVTETEVTIRVGDYPQLQAIAWNRKPEAVVTGTEALALYERNWRHVEQEKLTQVERDFIAMLTKRFGNGVFHA
jgi:hypothetical protein